MEKATLAGMLDEGLSLEEIGRRVGRDPSTVGYWVRKHGLAAAMRDRHLPKGAIPRERLEVLVEEGLPLREIARLVDRSLGTVRYWVKRYGLEPARARILRASKLPEKERMCRRHGLTLFVLEGRG